MKEIVIFHPGTRLLIVGDGPELTRIKARIKALQLQNNITIHPWTNNLIAYYEVADIFLITSNYEGYGRTALEAMRQGVPVIMTDVGLAGEKVIGGKNGIVTPVGDKSALTSAIQTMIESKERRKTFAVEARKTAKGIMSERAYLQQYKNLLATLVDNGKQNVPTKTRKRKLCYILPRYHDADTTHLAHIHDALRILGKRYDIHLVIERGEVPKSNIGATHVSVIGGKIPQMRVIKTGLCLTAARLRGYKHFYVHYSFLSALLASYLGKVFYWNCGEPWKYKRSKLREALEKKVYTRIDTLVTGTPGMKKQYAAHYGLRPENIKVMPNWINLSEHYWEISKGKTDQLRKKLGLQSRGKIALFVHRLSERKGANHIPEIAEELQGIATVVVVGEGPARGRIFLELKNHGLSDTVKMVGEIPNRELPEYYTLADVFIMPSEEEGFPHVILEAMAAGTPFVATDVGGVKEIVPGELVKYVVGVSERKEFIDKVKELLVSTPATKRKISEKEKEWVTQYDLKKVMRAFPLHTEL